MQTKTNAHPQIIYSFIADFWKERGHAPSPHEVAEHVGLSDNATRLYLLDLQSWGAIDWEPNKRRTLRITGEFRSS